MDEIEKLLSDILDPVYNISITVVKVNNNEYNLDLTINSSKKN
jgi:hypothetical protein